MRANKTPKTIANPVVTKKPRNRIATQKAATIAATTNIITTALHHETRLTGRNRHRLHSVCHKASTLK